MTTPDSRIGAVREVVGLPVGLNAVYREPAPIVREELVDDRVVEMELANGPARIRVRSWRRKVVDEVPAAVGWGAGYVNHLECTECGRVVKPKTGVKDGLQRLHYDCRKRRAAGATP